MASRAASGANRAVRSVSVDFIFRSEWESLYPREVEGVVVLARDELDAPVAALGHGKVALRFSHGVAQRDHGPEFLSIRSLSGVKKPLQRPVRDRQHHAARPNEVVAAGGVSDGRYGQKGGWQDAAVGDGFHAKRCPFDFRS